MTTDSPKSPTKFAFSIDEACTVAGIGRTFLYQEIDAGRLIARKARRRTIILRGELESWLSAIPPMKSAPVEPEAA